jgi:RNA polymerase sigma-70 factor, ECF subfamily
MTVFQESLVEHLPNLSAFARFLSRNRALADDLVQETVLRALCNADKFTPGTNMRAWLLTILRNQFLNELRARTRRQGYSDIPRSVGQSGEQDSLLEIRDLERVFRALPAVQRDALLLVGVSGFSYEEAAEVIGCAQGTVKSRVSRARTELDRRLARKNPTTRVGDFKRRHTIGDRAASPLPSPSSLATYR